MYKFLWTAALAPALAILGTVAPAQSVSFDTFLTLPASPQGINNSNEIVGIQGNSGYYRDRNGTPILLNYPGAAKTEAYGINNYSLIVGRWLDGAGGAHGFIRKTDGTYTNVDFPLYGVNDLGDAAGGANAPMVRYANGTVRTLTAGNAFFPPSPAQAINNSGQVVAAGATYLLYLFNADGSFTTTNSPCPTTAIYNSLSPRALLSDGTIVGTCGYRSGGVYAASVGFTIPARTIPKIPSDSSMPVQYVSITAMNDNGVFAGGTFTDTRTPVGFVTIPCPLTLGSTSHEAGNSYEANTLPVNVSSDCAYTARSNADWITLPKKTLDPGTTNFPYTVLANYGPARTGTITVGGQTFTITQARKEKTDCTPTLYYQSVPQPSLSFSADGPWIRDYTVGNPSVCGWSATTDVSWIQFNGATTKSGTAQLEVVVKANPNTTARTGHIVIGSVSVPVTQDGRASNDCLVTGVQPGYSVQIDPIGGAGSFKVEYSNCPGAHVSADSPWLTASGPDANGLVTFSAGPNLQGVTHTGYIAFTLGAGPAAAMLSVTQPPVSTPLSGLRFKPLPPCRIVDTRNTTSLAANTPQDFAVLQSACGIPSTAKAYSLNVTAVPKGPLSFLTIWPAGQPQPLVSTLNSGDGTVVANGAIVNAGTQGAVTVLGSNATDVILDINGYFVPATDPDALAFYTVTPCRFVDTRTTQSLPPGGNTRNFNLRTGPCQIPSNAQVYSLNVTVVPTGELGFLTMWPSDQPRPLVSTLNAKAGRVVANAAIVPAAADGSISVYALVSALGPVDVIIDINGYFAPRGGMNPLSFYPITPTRFVDTRNDPRPLLPGSTETQVVFNAPCGCPRQAGVFNITAVPGGPLAYLKAYPPGIPEPTVSTLNSADGRTVANMAIVALSNSQDFLILTVTAPIFPPNFVIDAIGYFAP